MNRRIMVLTLALLISLQTLSASIPTQINYQGYLTSPGGSPLDTVVAMTFKLYDGSSGGTQLWTETQPTCTVRTGLFNASLGSVTALPDSFNRAQVWLGVTVGTNTEMVPRSRLISVGYAYRVGTVDGARGGTISGDVIISGKGNIGSENINSGSYAFVAGESDTASGSHTTVGGGFENSATGSYNVVSGGRRNHAEDLYSSIGGGYSNEATAYGSGIASGYNNSVSGSYSFVGGGSGDDCAGLYAVLGGGRDNSCSGHFTHIGGGYTNSVDDSCSAIAGGRNNTIDSSYSFIGGGRYNHTREYISTIAGGYNNLADGGGFVGGGSNNVAEWFSVIGGGAENQALSSDCMIGGGSDNSITGASAFTFIGGGEDNSIINGSHAFVGGGQNNIARGDFSVVSGGGGSAPFDSNAALGSYSAVPGGRHNLAQGDYSFAAGRRAQALHNGSFVWADQTNTDFSSSATNQFNVRAAGGVRIYTNSAADWGVTLDDADNTWNSVCDSTVKTKLAKVNGGEVLKKIADVPVWLWYHKGGDPKVRHIGPMAQDFWNSFHVGSDSLKISTIDPDGIALAAIQELAKENAKLQTSNSKLEERINHLEKQLQLLVETKSSSHNK